MYGPELARDNIFYYSSKLIPLLLEQSSEKFKYLSCGFRITDNKKTTARAVFYNDFLIKNTYTIEASFGSFENKNN